MLCLQVSGWNDCLCNEEQMSVGFTYEVLSRFCSLFMNIVVLRKCTWFFEHSISNGIVGCIVFCDLGIVTIQLHCEAKL